MSSSRSSPLDAGAAAPAGGGRSSASGRARKNGCVEAPVAVAFDAAEEGSAALSTASETNPSWMLNPVRVKAVRERWAYLSSALREWEDAVGVGEREMERWEMGADAEEEEEGQVKTWRGVRESFEVFTWREEEGCCGAVDVDAEDEAAPVKGKVDAAAKEARTKVDDPRVRK